MTEKQEINFRCKHCNNLINIELRRSVIAKKYLFEYGMTLKKIADEFSIKSSTVRSDIFRIMSWINHQSFPLRNIYSNTPYFNTWDSKEIKDYLNDPKNKSFRDEFLKLINKEIEEETPKCNDQ